MLLPTLHNVQPPSPPNSVSNPIVLSESPPPRAASNAGAGVGTALPPALAHYQNVQRAVQHGRLTLGGRLRGVAPIVPAPLHPSPVVAAGLGWIAPALAGRIMSAKEQTLVHIRRQLTAQMTQVCVFS
jgi:hypothetical protein